MWPLELGIWTPMVSGGPSSRGYGLSGSAMAPLVGDMDSHALVWPLKLGIWTCMLVGGPLSWGYGHPCFHVAP